jgi:RHS repeat-associated protein
MYTTGLETFQRIAYGGSQAGGHWYVWRKDGVKQTFTPHVTLYSTLSWRLAQVEDTLGNVVTYTYWADGANAPYLDTVQYNGTTIRFHRELRPDAVTTTTGAGISTMRYRIKTIEVAVSSKRARAYLISYATSTGSNRSVLKLVQQHGSDVNITADGTITGGTSLPPTSFGWATGGTPGTWQTQTPTQATWSGPPASGTSGFDRPFATNIVLSSMNGPTEQVVQGDFDGDGRADRARVNFDSATGSVRTATALAEANGTFSSIFQTLNSTMPASTYAINQVWPVDLNGDGKTDLLMTFFRSSTLYLMSALATGDGTFEMNAPTPQATDWQKSNVNFVEYPIFCQTGTMNGDAKAALVCLYRNSGGAYMFGTASLKGDYTFNVVNTWAQVPFLGPIRTGDVNADGFDDVLMVVADVINTNPQPMYVALGSGNGNYAVQPQVTTTWTTPGDLYVFDVNGDGRADLVRANKTILGGGEMITSLQTSLTRADGTWSFQNGVQQFPTPLDPLASQVLVGDANGDGRTDLFVVTPYGATWRCTNATAQTLVSRVLAKADGTYDIPPTWDTCGVAQAVPMRWIYSDIDTTVKLRQPMIAALDADGDGLADFQAAIRNVSGYKQIVTARSQRSAMVPSQWLSGDLNGDGKNDVLNITSGASGVRIQTLITDTTGQKSTTSDLVAEITNPIAANWKVADVNADGRADLVYLWNDTLGTSGFRGLRAYTLLAKGDGTWDVKPHTVWPGYGEAYGRINGRDTRSWKAADVNGDGKTDLVHLYFAPIYNAGLRYEILWANGDGTWSIGNGTVTVDMFDRRDLFSDTLLWQPADINGDGKIDFVHVGYAMPTSQDSVSIRVRSLMGRGNGTFLIKTHDSWSGFGAPNTANWKVAEVNGDGKADLVHVWSSGGIIRDHTLIPHGDGAWTPFWQDVTRDAGTSARLANVLHWQVGDVNRDGKADLVHLEQVNSTLNITTYLARNTAMWQMDANQLPVGQWHAVSNTVGASLAPVSWWMLVDTSGDGTPDLTRMDQLNTTLTHSTITPNITRDLVTQVSNGLGQDTTITYGLSVASQKADPAAGCMLPMGMVQDIVTSVTVRDGRSGTTDTTTTDYRCARWSHTTRSFVGWQKVTDTHAATATQPTSVRVRQYVAREAGVMELLSDTTQDSSDKVIMRITQAYAASDPNQPYRSLVQRRTEAQCNGTVTCAEQQTDYTYDNFGNTLMTTEFNGVNGSAARVTTRTYARNSATYIVNAPASEVVSQQSTSSTQELSRKLFCYDGDTSCTAAPTRGLVTAYKTLNNQTNAYVTIAQSYDQWGNLTVVTDGNGNPTTTDYDATYRLYPVKITNALGHASTRIWDPTIGKLVQTTDLNGQITRYTYDALGRQIAVQLPNGQVTTTTYYLAGAGGVDVFHQRTVAETTAPDGSKLQIANYLDGLGRTWKVTKTDTATTQRAKLTDYIGATNRVYRESQWFRVAGNTNIEQPVWELTSFDAAGRAVQQTHEDKTNFAWSYGNDAQRTWSVATDERGHAKTTYRDMLGRNVMVRENNAGTASDTAYAYDMLDRLTSVTDSAGNVLIRTTWDSLIRKVRQQDVNLGTWSYTYDNVGNVLTQTDARGTVTSFTYDRINRVLTKNNGATTTWRYDEANRGTSIGRLTSVLDSTGTNCANSVTEQLSYDVMGNITSRVKCITGKTYRLSFSYDLLNRLASVTYPDGEVVRYGYDAGGRLMSVANTQGQTYVNALNYAADDQITGMTFGNGTTTNYTYDPNRAWLTGATVTGNGATLYQARYSYLSNGLIAASSSATNKLNLTYTYDDLDRLTAVSGDLTHSFTYNTLGNMTSNSALGAYSYPESGPNGCGTGVQCARIHAVRQAGTRAYTYDANGNMIATTDSAKGGTKRNITWNADNLPAQVSINGKFVLTAQYDAAGERVVAQRSDTVRYVGQWLEDSTTAGVTKYYFAGDTLVARRDAKGVVWFHGDLIESTRLLTNASGQVVQRYDYKPFGETLPSSGTVTTDIRYTGHRSEDAVGLIYMRARYYDPMLARFTAPDTIIPHLYDPQSLNRYTYVLNNPIKFNDPTGHKEEEKTKTAGTTANGDQAGTSQLPDNGGGSTTNKEDKGDDKKKEAKSKDPARQSKAEELSMDRYGDLSHADRLYDALEPVKVTPAAKPSMGARAVEGWSNLMQKAGAPLVEWIAQKSDNAYMAKLGPAGHDILAGMQVLSDTPELGNQTVSVGTKVGEAAANAGQAYKDHTMHTVQQSRLDAGR